MKTTLVIALIVILGVVLVLAEEPQSQNTPGADAQATAQRRDKRFLGLFGFGLGYGYPYGYPYGGYPYGYPYGPYGGYPYGAYWG